MSNSNGSAAETPQALVSAGRVAPGQGAPPDPGADVEELTATECWRLVRAHSIGRLALDRDDGAPDVTPLNYRVDRHSILMRSAPGGKLRSIRTRPAVAFEIDGMDAENFWSVVIRGVVRRMNTDDEIERSGVLGLVTSSPTAKHNFLRLTASTITGRRFRRTPAPDASPNGTPSASESRDGGPQKPHPIPHYAPLPISDPSQRRNHGKGR
jgi:hypothetical protein